MSEYLVGSPAFKAGGTGDPRPAGSIPVHLRHCRAGPRPAAGPYARRMKKIIVLIVLVALVLVAAKKLREV